MSEESGKDKVVVTCCPQCGNETLKVTITCGGSHPDEFGTNYWYEGDAQCTCGYNAHHHDSSH